MNSTSSAGYRLRPTGDSQKRSALLTSSPQPLASSPTGKDPFLLVLLPIVLLLLIVALALGFVAYATTAHANSIDWEVERVAFIRDLDAAAYDTPAGERQLKAFEALRARATELEKQHPTRAEPLVLHAWALRGQADAAGRSMAALTLGRDAVRRLEAAIERDPAVYGAATYATLGALYADVDVPGFRSHSRKKARLYLEKALALDPQGAPQNLSLAWVEFKEKDHPAALRLATAASNAPARPSREKADADLQERAKALIAAVNDEMR